MTQPSIQSAPRTSERTVKADGPSGPPGTLGLRNLAEFMRRPLAFLERAVAQHGDVVPFKLAGNDWVIFNHPDDIESMFVEHAPHMGRDEFARGLRLALGHGLLTSDGEIWKRQRKLASAAFTPKRIRGYAGAMANVTAEGLRRWRGDTVINLHEELSHLTMEVVADVLFGASVDVADVATVRETMEAFNAYFGRSPEALLKIPLWVPTPLNRSMQRALTSIDALVYRIIEARRREAKAAPSQAGERNDLLAALVAATDDSGTGMDDKQLRDETLTLFLAGHETTALLLTHALYLLARHPQAEQRLLSELDQVLGGRLPAAEDVPRLVYTERVLKEAMRLYPPAWVTGREATEDVVIGGHPVKRGTQVLVSQWLVHRDPRWFADPDAFDPDRFDPDLHKARPRFSYLPFGGGPRVCIGNHFAMMEAILMFAIIVRRFHVELPGHTELRFAPSVTLRPEGPGLKARIALRERREPQRDEKSPAA